MQTRAECICLCRNLTLARSGLTVSTDSAEIWCFFTSQVFRVYVHFAHCYLHFYYGWRAWEDYPNQVTWLWSCALLLTNLFGLEYNIIYKYNWCRPFCCVSQIPIPAGYFLLHKCWARPTPWHRSICCTFSSVKFGLRLQAFSAVGEIKSSSHSIIQKYSALRTKA